MGACMNEKMSRDDHQRRIDFKKLNQANPISKILLTYDTMHIKDQWDQQEFKSLQNILPAKDDQLITYEMFMKLFPKLNILAKKTTIRIFKMFCYRQNEHLSKGELIDTLTIIKKTKVRQDIRSILHYLYCKETTMTKEQLARFQTQNQSFLSPLGNNVVDDPNNPINSNIQMNIHQDEQIITNNTINNTSMTTMRGHTLLDESIHKQDKLIANQPINGRPSKENIPLTNNTSKVQDPNSPEVKFKVLFLRFNISKYQQLYALDLDREEQQLVVKLSKYQGIARKKGQIVYLAEYKWFLHWKAYAQQKYEVHIQLEEDLTKHYSTLQRKSKDSKTESKINYPRPGPIKNSLLLTASQKQNEMQDNLTEFSDYICLPVQIWTILFKLYKGGPQIKRIFPQIYYKIILQVTLNNAGKFQPQAIKESVANNYKVLGDINPKHKKDLLYSKTPGRNNWELQTDMNAKIDDKLRHQRNYVVFVPKELQNQFEKRYNIQSKNNKLFLQVRIKNYGSIINVAIGGILYKGLVVGIVSSTFVRVEIMDERGNIVQNDYQLENLKALNPSDLEEEKLINEFAGFENVGNVCFINSVLQCLIRTPLFGAYLQTLQFEKQDTLLFQIYKIYCKAKQYNQQSIRITPFKQAFDQHFPYFEGHAQHDAQQFLISLLTQISIELKNTRKEYGLNQSNPKAMVNASDINKSVVKFFSGLTETSFQCPGCHNKINKIEPFFTYSLSLPQLKQTQFSYIFVPKHDPTSHTCPLRYSITLHPKILIKDFINQICIRHNIPSSHLSPYTMFNNQWMSDLRQQDHNKQMAYYMNYNIKIICYVVDCSESVQWRDQYDNKTFKIELRQRIYSEKNKQYKSFYVPLLLQINTYMTWKDVQNNIQTMLKNIIKANRSGQSTISKATAQLNTKSIIMSNQRNIRDSQRNIRDSQREQPHFRRRQTTTINTSKYSTTKQIQQQTHNLQLSVNLDALPTEQNQLPKYKIRIIDKGGRYEDQCAICRKSFPVVGVNPFTRYNQCDGCIIKNRFAINGNTDDEKLFKLSHFFSLARSTVIVVDWQYASKYMILNSHQSYFECQQRSRQRRDHLEDILINNFNSREKIQLRCQKPSCGQLQAISSEHIINPPNIFLIHLKRFNYESNMLVKLTNNLYYPEELILPGSQAKYSLYGSVIHYGSGVGGHYIAYVKVHQKWYQCNDQKVVLAVNGAHISPNAYVLFYKKQDFEPSLQCLAF